MFIGHFAVGLALKKADKTLSLGVLFIAVQLSDLIFGFTLLAGIEKINIVAGANPLTSPQYVFFPYSHSLVATMLWAALIALTPFIIPLKSSLSKTKTALILAAAVLSHFILDALSHTPDIDILGNGTIKIGLSLWNNPLASYTVEALLLVTGLWIYLKATKSTTFTGKLGIPTLTIILLVLNAINTFGPAPPSKEYFMATVATVYITTIITAFWLDTKRN